MSIIRTLCIYVSKDVTIRGYCLKPKVFREQEVWETLAHTKTRLYRQTAVELVLKGCGNRALVKRVSSEQDLKKSPPPHPGVRHLRSRPLEPCAAPKLAVLFSASQISHSLLITTHCSAA